MKFTWSHLLPVLLLIVAVALETAASKDVKRESNRSRYGIFRKQRRSVSSNDDDYLPSGRIVTQDFINRIKGQINSSPSNCATHPEPIIVTTYTPIPTYFTTTGNTTARALSPLEAYEDYEYYDEDDDSDYQFNRNVDNRDDDDNDDEDDDDSYFTTVKNGQRVVPMRDFDSNNDLSESLDNDNEANSFVQASRNNQSNNVRRLRRQRRRAAARRRRRQRRRAAQRRRRLAQRRIRNNRRRRVTRRWSPGGRGGHRGRIGTRRGQNRIINI